MRANIMFLSIQPMNGFKDNLSLKWVTISVIIVIIKLVNIINTQ